MSKLLDKMLKAGSLKSAAVLSESLFFKDKDIVKTDLPILNIAFSGDVNGGMVSGLTIFAGNSKTFKTLAALYCMKAYLDKYPDSIAIMYDSEFGTPPSYMDQYNIDTSRVIHIPIEHVEQLKFDMTQRLNQVERGDKVFFLVDSLGNLASKKESEDALNEKSVADMSRAKAIRSWLRIITPHLTMKDLPCIVINHVYETMELYSKVVIPGGTAVTYAANQIFVFTKAQEKDSSGELQGWNFTINIEKSRFVKEKSKFPFLVTYKSGIQKWSGLMNIALDGGYIIKPKNGWYAIVDKTTGEISEKSYRAGDLINSDEVWNNFFSNTDFNDYIKSKYQMNGSIQDDISIEDEIEEILDK